MYQSDLPPILKPRAQCAAGYTVLVSASRIAWVAAKPSVRVWQAVGSAELAFLSAIPACSPLALGATMIRKRAITDQSEKVPDPSTLVTLIVRLVPDAA